MYKKLLQISLGLAVAGVFIYLSLREVAIHEITGVLGSISYGWILPYALVVTASNYIRAERWKLLLDDETGKSNSRLDLFSGAMYGYAANLAIPRAGEFFRAVYVSRTSGIETTKLFGTIVLERVIDIIIMVLMLLVTFILLVSDPVILRQLFGQEGAEYVLTLTSKLGVIIIGAGLLAGLAFILYLRKFRSGSESGPASETTPEVSPSQESRFYRWIKNFIRGLISLRKLRNWPLFVIYTLLIWAGYVVQTLIPFYAFDFHLLHGFGWEQAFVITVIGAIGVFLPSPGGIGTYHYMVQSGLVILYMVPSVEALSYATIGHFVNMVTVLLTALLLFVYTMFTGIAKKA